MEMGGNVGKESINMRGWDVVFVYNRENFVEMTAKNSPRAMREMATGKLKSGASYGIRRVGVRATERRTGEGQEDRKEREQHWEKT